MAALDQFHGAIPASVPIPPDAIYAVDKLHCCSTIAAFLRTNDAFDNQTEVNHG